VAPLSATLSAGLYALLSRAGPLSVLNIAARVSSPAVVPLTAAVCGLLLLLLAGRLALAAVGRLRSRPPQAAGLPVYFMALPPDLVNDVVSGRTAVKPHLLPRFQEVWTLTSEREETRSGYTVLLKAYEKYPATGCGWRSRCGPPSEDRLRAARADAAAAAAAAGARSPWWRWGRRRRRRLRLPLGAAPASPPRGCCARLAGRRCRPPA
jgi:hypothetical protein